VRHWIAVACIVLSFIPSMAAAQSWRQSAADELVAVADGQRLLLLGEMHGTREIPQLTGDVVERLSRSGPLLLALEIHASEHRSLAAYLHSDGSPAQREALRRRPYWSVPASRNDGRRSEDMLDLVEQVRSLRALGRDVAILPFDVANGDPRGAEWRDRAMAECLRRAWSALPNGRMLVLTGNVHAMRLRPAYAPPQMQTPMAVDLQDLQPYSIDIAAQAGEYWACPSSGCGPQPVTPGAEGGRLDEAEAYDYRLVLPRFTAARPVATEASADTR
jgi:erythromycin esterase-like protein